MKNKGLIVAFSCACIFVVALVATIIVLASGTQNVGSNVSLIYVASEIGGSVSGTYKVGNNPVKDMTNSSGAKVVSFGSDQPTTLSLLSPNETINLLYGESLILTYTFTNSGEEYYASMSYSDTDTPYTNLVFSYKKESDSDYSTTGGTLLTVPKLGTATFSVKISIENAYLNASLKGTIDWALVKEKPATVEDRVNLNIANNDGSSISAQTFSYSTREKDGKKQFKIIGATPVIESSSASSFGNDNFNNRTTTSTNGGVSSIDDLTNSNGAEFFYFCTNPAVVGSTSYNDPGVIYYTSTADSTLESWYDMPTSDLKLYACFIVPNYTTEELYTGTDTQIIISNKVTNIIYKAFYNNKTITDIAISQSVKNIGYGTNNTSSGAFYGCSKLQKIFIPNSVLSIGDSAFSNCSKLTDITIPDSVTNIGDSAFSGCSGLTSITIPDGILSLGRYTFNGCSGLTNITVGAGVTSIDFGAFRYCSGLTSIVVSEANTVYYSSGNCLIKKLDNLLILGCKTSVIPNGVTGIGANAFFGCAGLTSITIPDSVLNIGASAFYKCSGLQNITISERVASIGDYAFYGCNVLTNITIPNSVISIGEYAFNDCRVLTIVKIGNGVTSIGEFAFSMCAGLVDVTIGSSVTNIGNYAFDYCTSIVNITIPDSVTSIGNGAFNWCSKLTSVTFADANKTWTVKSGSTVKASDVSVADPAQNATYLTDTYYSCTWTKNS